MTKKRNIAIIGGDMRQRYLADILLSKELSTLCYGNSPMNKTTIIANNLNEIMENSTVLICPIPFTTDQTYIINFERKEDLTIKNFINGLKPHHIVIGGKFPTALKEYCCDQKITHYDLLENESFSINNAIATAEGAIMEAIQSSPINIHNSKCLILGFGRCGSVLANRLSNLNGNICILVRREIQAAIASSYGYSYCYEDQLEVKVQESDFIFNTIPSLILTEKTLKLVNKDSTIIDIAAFPGGLDYKYAQSAGINAKLCLGIPGKIAPLASARFIYEKVERIIYERTDIFIKNEPI